MRPPIGTLYFYHHEFMLIASFWILNAITFSSTYRHTGALCAMKEVNIIQDDAKSAESLKQLEQVWSYFIAIYSELMVSLQSIYTFVPYQICPHSFMGFK
jgi:hypothetical protein